MFRFIELFSLSIKSILNLAIKDKVKTKKKEKSEVEDCGYRPAWATQWILYQPDQPGLQSGPV